MSALLGLDPDQAAGHQVTDQAREVGREGIHVAVGETGGEDGGKLGEGGRLLEQPPERGTGRVDLSAVRANPAECSYACCPSSGHISNVRLWHKARAQLGAFEGTETAALPTLGLECRPTGGRPT